MIPRKQRSTQRQWEDAVTALTADPSTPNRARALVAAAAERLVVDLPAGATVAYGWSGGKDSQALRAVAEAAGVSESVLVLSELEFPAFVAWATSAMPDGCTVLKRPWGLDWLAAHPDMLFPATSAIAGRWFSGIQHWGQRRYVRSYGVDVLLLGRRGADGNYRGNDGRGSVVGADGALRLCPIFDWSHEDVLTVAIGHRLPLAPCYRWPRGFRVGTGPWPARQWCDTPAQGWAETWAIDQAVVRRAAAAAIPGAAETVRSLG